MNRILPLTNPRPAAWLAPSQGDEVAVGALVPADFQAYARVFNPVQTGGAGMPSARRWADFFQAAGAELTAHSTWDEIASDRPDSSEPEMGSIELGTARALVKVLREATGAPEECFFAMWEGYAGLEGVDGAATVTLAPDRECYVYEGAIEVALESFEAAPFERRPVRWWPRDHAWCVAGDVYSRSFIVGAATSTVEALLREPALEARWLDTQAPLRISLL